MGWLALFSGLACVAIVAMYEHQISKWRALVVNGNRMTEEALDLCKDLREKYELALNEQAADKAMIRAYQRVDEALKLERVRVWESGQ